MDDPLDFSYVKHRIDAFNENYERGGGNIKILDDPIDFSYVKHRIDAFNENYERGGGDVKIFDEPLAFPDVKPRIDAFNENYERGGGNIKIESEKLNWSNVGSKIAEMLRNFFFKPKREPKPILDEKLEFAKNAQPKVNTIDRLDYKPQGDFNILTI